MSDGSEYPQHKTLCRGWLEHKSIKAGSKYRRLWAVLEGNVIFIFSTDRPSDETQIGNLTLTDKTKVISKSVGSPSKGFKFELHTNDRITTFKTKKSSEREEWRGYITAVVTGHVPQDLDLTERDILQIQDDIDEYFNESKTGISRKDSRRSAIESGVFSIDDDNTSGVISSRSSRSSSSGTPSTLSGGGPTQVHMFYKDRQKNKTPPSWFIPHCSREMAEKLLQRTNSLDYGNTLLRESKTFLQDGSYVISRIYVDTYGKITYDHFEVIRTAEGYKVNVQNKHSPMKCLYDVLEYYVNTSQSGTRPIITNDLSTLGIDTPGYATEIYNRRKSQGRDSNFMEPEPVCDCDLPTEFYLPPDYDDAESTAVKAPVDTGSRHVDGSNTMSPGILRRDNRPPSGTSGRKSVGWNSVVTTPPPQPSHHTFAPGYKSQNRPQVPSVDEFKQRQQETDQLNDFDQMINSYERSSMYINTAGVFGIDDRNLRSDQNHTQQSPSATPPATTVSSSPLPPPAPHHFISHSYENQDNDLESIETLPVAPPPPRVPIVQTKTPPSSRPTSTSGSPSAFKFVSPTIPKAPPPPAASSPLKHSISMVDSHAKSVSPNISKSPSEGQIKKNVVSPTSPQNFPVWNNTANRTNNVNTNVPNKPTNVGSAVNAKTSGTDRAGVDENNPGGVSTLRERFNQMASPSQPGTKKGPMRMSLPVTWTLPESSSQPMTYEVPDVIPPTASNKNYSANTTNIARTNKTNTNNVSKSGRQYISSSKLSNTTSQGGDVYDDTAVPSEPTSAEGGRPPFVRKSTEPSMVVPNQTRSPPAVPPKGPPLPDTTSLVPDRLRQRRQTEPAVVVSREHLEVLRKSQDDSGFNEDFKKKLGALFGGAQPKSPAPVNAGRPVPRTPTNPRISQINRYDGEEHLYQELPEIEPDGVTYVNDRYNTDTDDCT